MSKYFMKTEEKILNKALEMFNERGVEYVGMREIASVLGIRVSNITYYFPTKDDLVNRLSIELNKQNNEVMVVNRDLTPCLFFEMLNKIFHHHVRYRCLLLSFVHLIYQNKLIAEGYKKTQNSRNIALHENFNALTTAGYLKKLKTDEMNLMVSTIGIIVRFWVSEAAVVYTQLPPEKQISHYLKLIGGLLMPHLTVKGKKNLMPFLKIAAG
ncbi:MAG: TetR family transcriptional regulator [Saprospiraceae bacterium]|nr:TetR family transcriptional regulator [Saprospiraceae bacterium]